MTEIKFAELVASIEKLGSAYKDRSDGKLCWAKNWQVALREKYERYKDDLKLRYTRDPNDLLDRHKVGAALIHAICFTKPLTSPDGLAIAPRWSQINYRLALHIGILVFRRYARQDAKDAADENALRVHTLAFQFPVPINNDGSYEDQTVKGLYEAHESGTFDPFLTANMLYLLDMYHRSAMETAAA